ncbi:hypothetical protein ACWD6Q_17845 [Streptomyces nigra]|uniref:hypothetical protein n=1 Tax=Streptomyces nigra TaxID=1827580 RepID=UPI003814A291
MRTTGLLGVLVVGLVTGAAGSGSAYGAGQGLTAGLRSATADPSDGRSEGPHRPGTGSRPSAEGAEGRDPTGAPSTTPARRGDRHEHRGREEAREARDEGEVRETWHSGRREPSPSASVHGPGGRTKPSGEPSRAGSRAGEGRERPGRPKAPPEESEATVRPAGDRDATAPAEEDTAPVDQDPAADATAQPSGTAADDAGGAGTGQRAQPVLQVLPLGTGLVLIGLGLGLAFVGLRLRRG